MANDNVVETQVENQEEKVQWKETCCCKHCHKKFEYGSEDIHRSKDAVYGFIQSVKCPYCNMRTIIH